MNVSINWRQFLIISGVLWILQASYTSINTGLVQQYSGNEVRWLAIMIYNYSAAFVWFLCTPLMLLLILTISNNTKSRFQIVIYHFVFAIIISALQRLANIFLSYGLIKITAAVDLSLLKLSNFFGLNYIQNVGNGIIVYFVLTAILYGFLFYRRNQDSQIRHAKLQSELSRVKLENLKYQLQPHFLYNSLQSVSTLMHRDIDAADIALNDLGELLRYSLRNIEKQKVTIGEELLFLQKYTDLQSTRFDDRLVVDIDFDSKLIDLAVPSFFIQPVVENTIKHVLEKSSQAVHLNIEINKVGDKLVVNCEDDGQVSSFSKDGSPGMGLANLELRLKNLYGTNFELKFGRSGNSGFRTLISIPVEKK